MHVYKRRVACARRVRVEGGRAGWPFLALPASGLLPIPHSLVKRAGREGRAGRTQAGERGREGGRGNAPKSRPKNGVAQPRKQRGDWRCRRRPERERERHLWFIHACLDVVVIFAPRPNFKCILFLFSAFLHNYPKRYTVIRTKVGLKHCATMTGPSVAR